MFRACDKIRCKELNLNDLQDVVDDEWGQRYAGYCLKSKQEE